MRLSAAKSHVRRFSTLMELTSGLPFVVGATENAGRGLFAVVPLSYGQQILDAPPVVCHPPSGDAAVCFRCLRFLPPPSARALASGQAFCSVACADAARSEFFDVQAQLATTNFEQRCAAEGELLPLLALRLACAVASGTVKPDVLSPLCFANGAVAHQPSPWLEACTELRAAFARAGVAADFLTPEWYVSTLARMHLNSFRVDQPRPDVTDVTSLARAAARGSGTAVYILPSLANHSCEPALDAVWRRGDSTLSFVCRRDVAAGEELTISYIDNSEALHTRREALRFAYGFTCVCPACTDEAADAAR